MIEPRFRINDKVWVFTRQASKRVPVFVEIRQITWREDWVEYAVYWNNDRGKQEIRSYIETATNLLPMYLTKKELLNHKNREAEASQ